MTSDPVKKTGKWVGTAGGIALALKSAFNAEWNLETGALDKLDLFGLPLFDRKRMEARRARRAARKKGTDA